MHRQPQAVQGRGDRIHQERHVVIDDLDHRMAGVPAMLVILRIVDPDLGHARLAGAAELPEPQRGAVEVVFLLADHVVRRNVPVIEPDECLGGIATRLGQPFLHDGQDGLDQRVFLLMGLWRHTESSRLCRSSPAEGYSNSGTRP